MNQIIIKPDMQEEINKLPKKPGVFYFSNAINALYVSLAGNLQGRVRFYLDKMQDDPRFIALKDTATNIYWEELPDAFNALIWQKKLIKKLSPQLQSQIKPYDEYCYLALDFEGEVQVQIKEDTQGDLFYIGPFRDRFFLADLIETFKQLFQMKDGKSYSRNLLIETYLRSGSTFLSILEKKRTDLFNEIKFEDSEIMRKQIDLLARFYQYMIFYYTARYINTVIEGKSTKIEIMKGMVKSVENSKGTDEFPVYTDIEYRDNEFLAVNKDTLDELWIVFFELVNTNKDLVMGTYQSNIKKVLTNLNYKAEENSDED